MSHQNPFIHLTLDPEEVRKATLKVLEDTLNILEMIECNDDSSGWMLPIEDIRMALFFNAIADDKARQRRAELKEKSKSET